MSDLVKRLRDMAEYRNATRQDWTREMTEAADRIEQLEQALVDLGVDHCIALNDLAAEKALADLLDREMSDAKDTATAQYKGSLYPENADGWEMCVNDMLCIIEVGRAAYRKARGL